MSTIGTKEVTRFPISVAPAVARLVVSMLLIADAALVLRPVTRLAQLKLDELLDVDVDVGVTWKGVTPEDVTPGPVSCTVEPSV